MNFYTPNDLIHDVTSGAVHTFFHLDYTALWTAPCRRHLNFYPSYISIHAQMALDWSTADTFTRSLHCDHTSRLHTLPRDVIDSLTPYLHTYTVNGCPYRDNQHHGTYKWSDGYRYGSCKYVDGKNHGYYAIWHADGGIFNYSEYTHGMWMKHIEWGEHNIKIYAHTPVGMRVEVVHTTMPTEYRYVWEIMTRVVDI